ncbi:FAD-dependent oxidoreductase [Candidatus Bathyarchaeota archaeon]|nr:FAD-dependent oxidoreductase [Candidatus Bathyarchaeota archaeon]
MKFETHVKEIIYRTYNVTSFRFSRPSKLDYLPGQFFFITIKGSGKELKKHFSFSSSPLEQNYIEFTKKLSNSDFSGILKKLVIDDWARIEAPFGKFTFIGENKKIALLAGGIGITPFRSICKYCTDKHLKTKITLIYGNRTEEDIVFREDFEKMQKQNKNLNCVFMINEGNDNWKGLTGFINAEMIKKEIPDYKNTIFFLCGPPGMVKALEGIINQLGILANQIRVEYFTGYI